MLSLVFLSCFVFCILVLRLGMSFEAESGAIYWHHEYWTGNGECWNYEFWQKTLHSPIYAWRLGWDTWRELPDFDPTPGRWAFVTDLQWISQVLQIKKQSYLGKSH